MNIDDVMEEIAERLRTVVPNSYGYPVDTVPTVPAASVEYPEIDFDQMYERAMDQMVIRVWVFVARPYDRVARANIAPFVAGSGDSSIKALLESGTYTAFDGCHVRTAAVAAVPVGTVEYLGAKFDVAVWGEGNLEE